MKTIRLSRNLIDTYKAAKVNISYAICELLGYADYDCCTKICAAPIQQQDTIDYPLDEAAYDALREKFDCLDSYGEVAEILLWSNYWMGARL